MRKTSFLLLVPHTAQTNKQRKSELKWKKPSNICNWKLFFRIANNNNKKEISLLFSVRFFLCRLSTMSRIKLNVLRKCFFLFLFFFHFCDGGKKSQEKKITFGHLMDRCGSCKWRLNSFSLELWKSKKILLRNESESIWKEHEHVVNTYEELKEKKNRLKILISSVEFVERIVITICVYVLLTGDFCLEKKNRKWL